MMAWNPAQPYHDLPPLPPNQDVETRPVLKQCIAARAALAELKQAAELIPNQGMLINSLPLLEAQASSEIENIVTTTDRLFQYQNADEHADPATREALRYSSALMEGFRVLKETPLWATLNKSARVGAPGFGMGCEAQSAAIPGGIASICNEADRPKPGCAGRDRLVQRCPGTRIAEQVCSRIKGVQMQVRRVPGTALVNDQTGAVIYTPPTGEDVLRGKLANWERYLHETPDVDPLIRMAVGHYQFEAIHPFTDGNGRTGRVLNSLFLIQEGLLTLPILYLSRYIINHKADYYRLLLAVTREQDWEPWLIYMLRGIEETARWTTAKIAAIRQLSGLTVEHVRQAAPKIYSREWVDLIFERPYCRIQNVVDKGLAGRQAASRHLKQLADIGVLREVAAGREKLFIHPKLVQLLTRDDNTVTAY